MITIHWAVFVGIIILASLILATFGTWVWNGFPTIKSSEKHDKYEDDGKYKHCEIEYFPHVKKYSPKYWGQYIVIWRHTGEADTISSTYIYTMFNTREEAINYLNEWLERKGIGTKIEKL